MMETAHFTSPPPNMGMPPPMGAAPANMALPPPNMSVPPPMMPGHPHGGHQFNRYNAGGPPAGIPQQGPRHQHFFQPFRPYPRPTLDPEFDGKRLRKSVMRKTVDYNAAIIKLLEARVWQRDFRDRRALQPDVLFYPDLQPPRSYEENPMNAVTTRFVKTATNKMRCPVFCMAWTPEGRRLVTGASSGEFTLWNGLTFNFETILQAHDSPVRTMVWSHNEQWMVTADNAGYVKYWQSNMNNVKMFQGHKETVRGIRYCSLAARLCYLLTVIYWLLLDMNEKRNLSVGWVYPSKFKTWVGSWSNTYTFVFLFLVYNPFFLSHNYSTCLFLL